VDVSAQGQTQEELVSTLKGTASLSLPQGQIAGTDLPGLFATVREKIVEGWSAASGNTPLTAVDAKVTLEDGLATLSSGTAALATYPLSLSGTVDLLRRALDLRLGFPQPEAAPLPVPVIIQGNWSAPRIYPDVPDILNNPQGGFARLRDAGPAQGN
jgi:AsmA protein